ncbi:Bax inhibitor-1/YccA family protein [Nocardioides marmorisolisilvae]|uniref:Bax inhibitor-1/YccA family protein n=1 Tax=Nocardioides marmorisolisilvae TaxID=1542737 RepID=A0A3N0DZ95_9ACTN|nr:Bax inhibitor-1/YccA family protein [Nocardioides marmorisolisilvae]RNL80922.1 Bax inhibitor-1/YccA family protein [Nocardioides marmorisolisilvae]
MQSSNPVFTRSEGFNGKNQTSYASFDQPAYGGPITHTGAGTGRMTIDSVVQKTGITLGILVVVAAAVWIGTGDVLHNTQDIHGNDVTKVDTDKAQLLYTLSIVGAFGGFILSLVNSFKRVISPALVIAYAALEGLFVGAMSKVFQLQFGGGVVTGAVIGTIAAVAGTLAAYKIFDIQVSNKFRTWVIGMMFGFVAVTLLDAVLGIFKSSIGFNGFGGLGLLMSVVGLGLGVLMLILDFDFVERGIAAGLPERESWRAAFGFTVTIIWIYIELLRILAILRGND